MGEKPIAQDLGLPIAVQIVAPWLAGKGIMAAGNAEFPRISADFAYQLVTTKAELNQPWPKFSADLLKATFQTAVIGINAIANLIRLDGPDTQDGFGLKLTKKVFCFLDEAPRNKAQALIQNTWKGSSFFFPYLMTEFVHLVPMAVTNLDKHPITSGLILAPCAIGALQTVSAAAKIGIKIMESRIRHERNVAYVSNKKRKIEAKTLPHYSKKIIDSTPLSKYKAGWHHEFKEERLNQLEKTAQRVMGNNIDGTRPSLAVLAGDFVNGIKEAPAVEAEILRRLKEEPNFHLTPQVVRTIYRQVRNGPLDDRN